jgi:hypothetical protein
LNFVNDHCEFSPETADFSGRIIQEVDCSGVPDKRSDGLDSDGRFRDKWLESGDIF